MIHLTGLHILLTYQCTYECDHCFVWGSPRQNGTLTLANIQTILEQARDVGSVEWIYFEGGEPFLFYPILVAGISMAGQMGFKCGIVTNAYWANSLEDARVWLKPLAGYVQDLSISTDLYHAGEWLSRQAQIASQVAQEYNLPASFIKIAQPGDTEAERRAAGTAQVRYRGRAAFKLSKLAPAKPWDMFNTCPAEDLVEPGRVHVDHLGFVHICQGISIGNIFQTPLNKICETYQPNNHPITGPLVAGGPTTLARHYAVDHQTKYADACHLCYMTREQLRIRFPQYLVPDQMYGS